MKIHEKYISRCIQLAKNGLGPAFPNPMVGSVIVHNGKIIGEGFTSPFGGSHAEVNAIQSVRDLSLLPEATIYVTLEPCSHIGKTPPCADLIIQHRIPKVVIGIKDPHKKVAGNGIKKLKNAGCTVIVGVLEEECREHHKRFLTFHEKKRPYIVLKWAETMDGFIAPDRDKRKNHPEPVWITNDHSRQIVHQWRSQEQAILVGTNTVLQDNPKLDVRHWKGKSPIRLIMDKTLKIDGNYHVLDGSIKTIVLTEVEDHKRYRDGIDYEVMDFSKNIAQQVCDVLYNRYILSAMVEGGTQTLQTFIDADLWDEARIFIGNTTFGKGVKAPCLSGKLMASTKLEDDTLNTFRND